MLATDPVPITPIIALEITKPAQIKPKIGVAFVQIVGFSKNISFMEMVNGTNTIPSKT